MVPGYNTIWKSDVKFEVAVFVFLKCLCKLDVLSHTYNAIAWQFEARLGYIVSLSQQAKPK